MLDMFPEIIKRDNFDFVKEKHAYYSLPDISKENYTYEDEQELNTPIKLHYGGIRKKVFKINPCLTKHALLFLDNNTKRSRLGHFLAKGKIADFSAVLFHYKFSGSFYNYFKNAVDEGYHHNESHEYKAYCQVFDKKKYLVTRYRTKFGNIKDLIEKDFLTVSQRYLNFVKEEQNPIKFIIFAHARSGSNSLAYILGLHPLIKIAIEPLNVLVPNKDITIEDKLKVKDEKSLKEILKKIGESYNSFKTLSDKYEIDELLLKNKNYKIIFLKRKNLLKTAVSHFVSKQTDIWFCDEKSISSGREKIKNHNFNPVSVEFLEREIKYLKNSTSAYRNLMLSSETNFLEVNYEDLFEDGVKIDEKLKKINEIFEFLGYQKITKDEDLEKIKKILDPENRKINNTQTYQAIPNILDIEEKLGSIETGFLFK
jgi:hypothetical protein